MFRLSKHLEVYQMRVPFSTLFSVFEYPDETRSLVFDILDKVCVR